VNKVREMHKQIREEIKKKLIPEILPPQMVMKEVENLSGKVSPKVHGAYTGMMSLKSRKMTVDSGSYR
jgi:hypothetical protein